MQTLRRGCLWALAGGVLMAFGACEAPGSTGRDAGAVHGRDAGPSLPDAGEDLDGGEVPPPDAGPPPPWTVSGTQVQGAGGAKDVRQGGGAFVLEVDGTSLSSVEAWTLEGFTTTVSAKSDTQVLLAGTVAHGAVRSARGLTLSGGTFKQTLPNALVVTAVSAARAGTASDTNGRGTASAPYATLKHALSVAKAGDTVALAAGTYSTASGESWPAVEDQPMTPSLPPNVPAGVIIEGAGDLTILAATSPAAKETGLVFSAAADGGVRNLHLQDFHRAVLAELGNVLVDHVSIKGGQSDAVLIGPNATGTVTGCDLYGSSGGGVATFNGKVFITGSKMHENRTGLYLYGGTTVLKDSSLTGNGVFINFLPAGVYIIGGATLTSAHNTFSGNQPAGIYVYGNGAHLSLDGDILFGNGTAQQSPAGDISLSATAVVLKARNVVTHDSKAAITASGDGTLDLGTAAEAGNNTFAASGTPLVLNGDSATLQAKTSHTTFNGSTPPAKSYVGPLTQAWWKLTSAHDSITAY